MRWSQLFIPTLREDPADAEVPSHRLLLRAGFIDQLMAGVYTYLPLGWRAKRKAEQIVREELDAAGAQEVLMPVIQPIEIWQQSGRDEAFGPVLFRLRDQRDRTLVLGPTHEEVITRLFADHTSSYRDVPVTLYQIQTKFRDERRPRGGIIRVREFTMKDAYSFDLDEEGLDASYEAMFQAYRRIFARCGIPTVAVEADSGAIGGKGSQEFIFLSDAGEDTIALCEGCGYAANLERIDARLGRLLPALREADLLVATADHGNDPSTPSTDHSREYVPILLTGPRVRKGTDLGTRATFADLGQTIADNFGVGPLAHGTSFLEDIVVEHP